ncbi:MAG: Dabb family protein [Planctomycetota bacterium]
MFGKSCVLLIGLLLVCGSWGIADDGGGAKVLRHVVMFQFKEGTPPEKIKEIEDGFRALPGKIETIQDFEWGTALNAGKQAQGFSHCFFVTFKDEEGLKVYGPHPAHQAFVAILKPHMEKCLVIDYMAGK